MYKLNSIYFILQLLKSIMLPEMERDEEH